jgi:hypothetical protein
MIVMRGLDPRIHLIFARLFRKGMDCRVKPGNDDGSSPEQRRARHEGVERRPELGAKTVLLLQDFVL